VLDGSSTADKEVYCLQPGINDATSSVLFNNVDTPIVLQCCTRGSTNNAGCRRYVGANSAEGCLSGKPPGEVRATTYSDAWKLCNDLDLELCDRSCAGRGCEYNSYPVISSQACIASAPPPPSAPSIPIPEGGVAVLDGSSTADKEVYCLQPGINDATSSVLFNNVDTPIVLQCCTRGSTNNAGCRRYVGANSAEGCLSGKPPGEVRATTYSDAWTKCNDLDLELCDRSCAGLGCEYNSYPVISSQACIAPPPPSPPAGTPAIPAGGVQVVDGKDGSFLGCLEPGKNEDTTQIAREVGGKLFNIAAQCCSKNGVGPAKCRREVKPAENLPPVCVAGQALPPPGKAPRANTYSQMVEICEGFSTIDDPLEPCDQSCSGGGCGYNSWPVYTNIPCAVRIPDAGVSIVSGADGAHIECLKPGDEEKALITSAGKTAALQCCVKGSAGASGCRRYVNPDKGLWKNHPEDCVGGVPPDLKVFNYTSALAECEKRGAAADPPEALELCDNACVGLGCAYNSEPVMTRVPCPL